MTGTASTRNTGIASGEVAVLNSGGTFDPARLGGGGQANRVLTWASGAATWEDAGTGTGDITGIVTATASGLDGGATTGTATLELNASNLAGYQNTTAAANDTMVIFNQADGETERITISQLGLTLSSGSVTDTGNQRSFVVPDSGVTGTADDIILTTGLATNLSDGDEFYFTPSAVNTGAVTVNIDGNGADALVHYRDSGLRALNADELQSQPVIITYQMSDDRFLWRPAAGSTASYYQVAAGNGDLAVLGPQGVFDPDRLGISGMAGYVLSYVDTQAVWVAAGGGTGDIEGITTLATSGLAGGAVTGTPSLSLDLSGLAEANGQFITRDGDFLYIEDRSETPNGRQISIFELQQALMRGTDTNHQNPSDSDRFFINDVSYQQGTPRYITWRDLRSRFVEAAQMHVADSVAYDNANTRINVTISVLGSTANIRDGSGFIFAIPTLTGSTAATELVISVNGQTDYPWFTDNGIDRITAGELVEGDRVAVIRDGSNIYWMFGGIVGGAGTITAIGTAATSGLSGGMVSGSVDLLFNPDGLREESTSSNLETNDRLIFVDASAPDAPYSMNLGRAVARMGDQSTIVTSSGVMSVGVIANANITDSVIAEAKLDISNDPSADDVLSWNGTAMTWAPATAPPPATHTSYTATGADQTFTEAEFTGTQGNSGTGNSVGSDRLDWVSNMLRLQGQHRLVRSRNYTGTLRAEVEETIKLVGGRLTQPRSILEAIRTT